MASTVYNNEDELSWMFDLLTLQCAEGLTCVLENSVPFCHCRFRPLLVLNHVLVLGVHRFLLTLGPEEVVNLYFLLNMTCRLSNLGLGVELTNIIIPFQEVVFESGSSVVRLLDEPLVVAHQSLCVVCYPLCFSFDLVSLVLQVLTVNLKT